MSIPATRLKSGSVDEDELRELLKDKRDFIQTLKNRKIEQWQILFSTMQRAGSDSFLST